MPSLLFGAVDFSISSLASLSTTQLALARLHPDFDESDALRICQLFFHRREKARQAEQQRSTSGGAGGGDKPDQDEEARFALVGLDFELDDKLEGLSAAQLAAVVVLAHPDASELQVLKAERIWRKRREKAAQGRIGNAAAVHNSTAEKPSPQVPPTAAAERPFVPPKLDKPPAPAPVPRPPSPSPPAARPRQPQPPQAAVVPARRREKTPRLIPPLPPVGTRIPDTLCQEIYSLKLSNLPVVEIKTRDDVSSLFPRHLLPDAVVLHRPIDAEDVSRTAYVGWTFDFEKRTEAMQEVIRVRMGRWRAMAEFVECGKPKWEWGDLAKVKRQHAWKVWNDKEQAREEEAARKTRAEEDAIMVVQGSTAEEDHVEEGGYLVPPASDEVEPLQVDEEVFVQPLHAVPATYAEPEAIILDSPALPPIPSRAPSRAGSSRNDANNSFRLPPSRPTSPAPRQSPAARDQRESRPSTSRPSSPPPFSPVDRRGEYSSAQRHHLPPHIAARTAPVSRPSTASIPSSNATPVRAHAPPPARPPPQLVESSPPPRPGPSARELSSSSLAQNQPRPARPGASARDSSSSSVAQNQPRPAPAPSLLARTTEIEVRGSAPTPSQAKKSLMSRLSGDEPAAPSLMDRLGTASAEHFSSPAVASTRGQSPASNVPRNSSTANSRPSPGLGKGGGNARGRGTNAQSSGANSTAQGGNASSTKEARFGHSQSQPQSRQQQKQQQPQQNGKGKKRAVDDDLDPHDGPAKGRHGGGGGGSGGGTGSSLSDRIEGSGSGRGPAKKAKNVPTNGGGDLNRSTRDADQGRSSLLSRIV